MARLEDLTTGTSVRGLTVDGTVEVIAVTWNGENSVSLVYRTPEGQLGDTLLFRDDEPRLTVGERTRPWSFDGDGHLFRLAAEALRIRLAYLFDPLLAVHTSLVERGPPP